MKPIERRILFKPGARRKKVSKIGGGHMTLTVSLTYAGVRLE